MASTSPSRMFGVLFDGTAATSVVWLGAATAAEEASALAVTATAMTPATAMTRRRRRDAPVKVRLPGRVEGWRDQRTPSRSSVGATRGGRGEAECHAVQELVAQPGSDGMPTRLL